MKDLAAPLLFSQDAMQQLEVLERRMDERREFTAERIRAEAPRLAEAVLKLAARDCPDSEIADILNVSRNTIARLKLEHACSVEHYKEGLTAAWRRVNHLTLGAIEKKLTNPREVEDMSVKDLAVLAGIGTEKAELLAGGVTQRIGHQADVAPIDAFNKYLEQLPELQVVQGMGLSARDGGQTREAAPTPRPPAVLEVRTDEVSDALPPSYRESEAPATMFDADADAIHAAPEAPQGGRGSRDFRGGGVAALGADTRHEDKGDLLP